MKKCSRVDNNQWLTLKINIVRIALSLLKVNASTLQHTLLSFLFKLITRCNIYFLFIVREIKINQKDNYYCLIESQICADKIRKCHMSIFQLSCAWNFTYLIIRSATNLQSKKITTKTLSKFILKIIHVPNHSAWERKNKISSEGPSISFWVSGHSGLPLFSRKQIYFYLLFNHKKWILQSHVHMRRTKS